MGSRTGKNAQIYKLFYTDNDNVAAGAYNIGDEVSNADLIAAPWNELKPSSDSSSFKLDDREPLVQPQFSGDILADYSQPGLEKFEGQIEIFNYDGFLAAHEDFIGAGLGEIVDNSSLSDTIATVTDQHTFVVTTPGSWSGVVAGDWIKFGDKLAVVKTIDSGTGALTTYNDVGSVVATDAVVGVKCIKPKQYDNNKYFHLLIETEIGTFVAQWVKPAFSHTSEYNALKKWVIKLNGDNARYNSGVTEALISAGGGITSESKSIASAPNWRAVYLNTEAKNTTHTKVIINLDREPTVIPQEGTETGNGFGGVAQDKLMLSGEIEFSDLIDSAIRTNYADGDKIYVMVYNKDCDFGFFSDGTGITQIQNQLIDEGEARPKALINLNEKEDGIISMIIG